VRGWKGWFSLLLFTISIFLIWLFLRGVGKQKLLLYFGKFSPVLLAFLSLCVFMRVFFSSLAFQTALRAVGEKLPLAQTFKIRLISFSIGYVTPSASFGGEPFAALLAADKKEYEKVFAATLFYRVLEGTAGLSIQTLGLLILLLKIRIEFYPLTILLLVMWLTVLGMFTIWRSGKTPLSYLAERVFKLPRNFVVRLLNFEKTFSSILNAHPRDAFAIFHLSLLSLSF